MNTDIRLLLYHSMQYGYNKHVRTKYRINGPQLSILTAIYYATKVNPKRWQGSVKQCIRTLNPQLRADYIIRDLHVLKDRELITYTEIAPKNYRVKLTSEGIRVIEELFNVEAIDTYIRDNKDRV